MQQNLNKLLQNSFFQGTFLLTLTNFFVGFLNYAFNSLAGKALGPVGFGEITALFSYLSLFAAPLTVINMLIIQKIGATNQDKAHYAKAVEQWIIGRLKKWWIIIPLSVLIVPFISPLTNLQPFSSYILLPLLFLTFLSTFYDASFQGLHIFWWFAILSIIVTSLKVIGSLIAYFGFPSIEIILIFIFISGIVKLILSKIIFNKKTRTIQKVTIAFDKRIKDFFTEKQVWITLTSFLSITMLNNIDVIFAKKFLSAHDAGLYGSWSLFARIILYVVGPVVSMAYIFYTNKEYSRYHKRIFLLSMVGLILFGILSYIGYVYFGIYIVRSLLNEKFIQIVPLLGSASIFGILYVLVIYMNNYFIAKQSSFSYILPVFMPAYIIALFVTPKTINNIILVNIFTAAAIALAYFIAYTKSVFYNTGNGK